MNANTPAFGLNEIGQVTITITDLEKATPFYRDALGMKHLFSAPPGLAFFAVGNVRLMLSRPETKDFIPSSSPIYFKVADIQAARDSLAARGVTFESEPHLVARMPDHELWMAFFRDPDRNLLALMSEKRS